MFKKLKDYINKRKQKKLDYWSKLDLEREEKIEKIKKSRSDRFLKDSKSLVFQALFFLIIFLIIPLYMFVTSKVDFNNIHELSSAYAEEINISNVAYEDVVNDSTAIVNFNQLIKNDYVNFSSVPANTNLALTYGSTLKNYDVFYIKFEVQLNNGVALQFDIKRSTDSSNVFSYTFSETGKYENVFTLDASVYCYVGAYTNGSGSKVNVQLTNLTQMFGSENDDLTLEECQELFVADYYVYDVGSAVSLSGLNAYAEGVQSVYEILTYNYVGEDSYNLLQPYAFYRGATYYNGAPSKEQSHISVASVDGDGWSSGNGFALYYPFTSSLVAGDTIVLNGMLGSATDLGLHQQATTYVIIRYGENIYDVLSVDNIVLQDADTNNINSFTYTLPSDATGLVFYSIQPFRIKNLTIQVKSLSINNLIDSAYKNGFENGSNPYRVGNNGYNQIFEAGRLQGVQDAGEYTFLSLLTTAIDVPINSVLHMLDFDLLGMNMKSFYLSMFTFAIIVFVIKLLI